MELRKITEREKAIQNPDKTQVLNVRGLNILLDDNEVQELVKLFTIPVFSQKRKLLLDFISKVNGNLIMHPHLQMSTDFVDEYLKSNNYG